MADINRRMGLPEGQEMAIDANQLFPLWATTGSQPWTHDGAPFGLPMFHMIESFWRYRHLPNILLLHYADLTADLESEMRRVACFLGVEHNEGDWPQLVEAASFAGMKNRAEDTAPDADLGEWSNSGDFFRSARRGAWRTGLSEENKALYENVNSSRLDPQMKAWAEHGGIPAAAS